MPALQYLDAHLHLQDEWLEPHLESACDCLEQLPVREAVVNGTFEGDWAAVAGLRQRYRWVRASYGLHPWYVGNRSENWQRELERWVAADPHAGIGEIGLDRWILDSAKPNDPRLSGLHRASLAEQQEVFRWQLQLAAARNRPVTIHCLEAWGLMEKVLREERRPGRGFLLHAYGGPAEMVGSLAELGAYFSFNGYFLDPRKEKQQRAFKTVPRDRLLIETDAPSMPLPQAWRTHKLPNGQGGSVVNHPGNIEATYAGLAALLGSDRSELSGVIAQNHRRFFGEPGS